MASPGPLANFPLWVFMILVCCSHAKPQQRTPSSTLPQHHLACCSHLPPALLQPDSLKWRPFILSSYQGTQGDAKGGFDGIQAIDRLTFDTAKEPPAADERNLIASAAEGFAWEKEFLTIASNGKASGQSGVGEITASLVVGIDGRKEERVKDEEEKKERDGRLEGLQKFYTKVGQLRREGRQTVFSEHILLSTPTISPRRVLQAAAALNNIGVPNLLQEPGTQDTKIATRNLAGGTEPVGPKSGSEGGRQDLKVDADDRNAGHPNALIQENDTTHATGSDTKKSVNETKDNQGKPTLEQTPNKPSTKERKDNAEKPSDDNHVGVKNGEQDLDTKDECDKSHGCVAGNLFACLRTPGDGTQELSLWVKNGGDKMVDVVVTTPDFLEATPSDLKLEKGTSKAVRIVMLDSKADKHNDLSKITVNASEHYCNIEVPSSVRHIFRGFNYSSSITPVVGVYILLFVFVAIAGVWLYCRYQRKRWHGKVVKYHELEMGLPGGDVFTNNSNQDVAAKNPDGWEEKWDDGWEDAKAARASLQLTQSLSFKGLAARRSNKDGWDD